VRGLPAYGVARRSNSLGVLRQRDGGGGGASSLLTGLVSYWNLDETSGTRFDSAGTNNLTDTGGVGSTIGIQGNAATGFGASTFLSNTSDITQITGDWTIALWFRTGANVNTNQALVSRWGATSLDQEYIVYVHVNSFRFLVNAPSIVFIDLPVTANTTYLGFAWHDATAGRIYVQLNDGGNTSDTVGVINTSAGNTFRVGQRGDTSLPWLGDWIDEIGIWGRVLTPAERTQICNGGAGITYPFS
jgi:hypothetical protein